MAAHGDRVFLLHILGGVRGLFGLVEDLTLHESIGILVDGDLEPFTESLAYIGPIGLLRAISVLNSMIQLFALSCGPCVVVIPLFLVCGLISDSMVKF